MPLGADPPSAPDWDAIRRDYEAGQRTVEEICVEHQVQRRRFYTERQQQGWTLRRPKGPAPARAHCKQRSLAGRLVNALDRKMRQFERRLEMAAGNGNAADSERDARTLNTLARLCEKLTALQAADAASSAGHRHRGGSAAPASAATEDTTLHDQERLRGELARRLDTLRTQIGG